MRAVLPAWFRQEIPSQETLNTAHLLSEWGLHTVCQEAQCPNSGQCFRNRKVTFIILGDTCTRNCRFCRVKKGSGDLYLDKDEPLRIARAVERLNLDYVVITSVTRDDLEDAGAGIFARTIKLIRGINPDIKIEVLIPDFRGSIFSLSCVLDAYPNIVAHNIETPESLYKEIRPLARYSLSLNILSKIKELMPHMITKSSIMLGLGETEAEVIKTMQDLRNAHCDILTLGQYLAPSTNHYPVKEFIGLTQFKRYAELGYALGFRMVLSGPLVRSSYKAQEIYAQITHV